MHRPVPFVVALLVLIPAIASPLALAVHMVAAKAEEDAAEARPAPPIPAVPSLLETDLLAYDVASLKAGDWVEYDTISASAHDVPARVRTRLSCVGLQGSTVWIETVDYLLARFYPGTVILCDVDRESARIRRAWWGPPGGEVRPIRVEAAPAEAGQAVTWRAGDAALESVPFRGGELHCELVRVVDQPSYLQPGCCGRTMTWICPEVPFARRASTTAADGEIAWDRPRTLTGGVAREIYNGLTVQIASRIVAWGSDARPSVRLP